MLLHKLVAGSVESGLPFSSNHGEEDVICDWNIRLHSESSSMASNCYAIPNGGLSWKAIGNGSLHEFIQSSTPSLSLQQLQEKENIVFSFKRIASSLSKPIGTKDLVVLGTHFPVLDVYKSLLPAPCPTHVPPATDIAHIFQYCDLCGVVDNTLNMLLCDHCEGAFHLSCCNTNNNLLPLDQWFCQTCSKLDDKLSLEASFLRSCENISWWNGFPKFKSPQIESMLKYRQPYISRVRIGDSFQAAVPHWYDQLPGDFDCIGEPLEMDPAETIGLHGSSTGKHLKPNSLSNWLQCQEVLHDGIGEFGEGNVCGKWRRAPLCEVQTDDWDCSCAVRWDPSHSDCAVPQELDTDEVLSQLRHKNELKSRVAVKNSRH